MTVLQVLRWKTSARSESISKSCNSSYYVKLGVAIFKRKRRQQKQYGYNPKGCDLSLPRVNVCESRLEARHTSDVQIDCFR